MVVESTFDEHARDSVFVLRLLRSERAHHLCHLLPSEVQVNRLSVSGVVDLHLHVLKREWKKRREEGGGRGRKEKEKMEKGEKEVGEEKREGEERARKLTTLHEVWFVENVHLIKRF